MAQHRQLTPPDQRPAFGRNLDECAECGVLVQLPHVAACDVGDLCNVCSDACKAAHQAAWGYADLAIAACSYPACVLSRDVRELHQRGQDLQGENRSYNCDQHERELFDQAFRAPTDCYAVTPAAWAFVGRTPDGLAWRYVADCAHCDMATVEARSDTLTPPEAPPICAACR